MFESEDFLYHPLLIMFSIGIPFAIFCLVLSFFYIYKWILSRDKLFLRASAYGIIDGTFSVAFASIGIWVVLKEIANLWLVLMIFYVIALPPIFIARKFRHAIFFGKPPDASPSTVR